jgi:L-threonylcarbamoyladenylate synthase
MKTRIIKIDSDRIQADSLQCISGILKKAGVIVYPTDTFYGLGADCFSDVAVSGIYAVKKRTRSKALSILAGGMNMVQDVTVSRPPEFKKLAEQFWPGPLTLILKAAPHMPGEILGADRTLGIRWPDCPWISQLLHICGFPITATSANLSGQAEISQAETAVRIFKNRVDGIVDGGPTPGGKPSTIVDLTQKKPVIIREGAIPASELLPLF